MLGTMIAAMHTVVNKTHTEAQFFSGGGIYYEPTAMRLSNI